MSMIKNLQPISLVSMMRCLSLTSYRVSDNIYQ